MCVFVPPKLYSPLFLIPMRVGPHSEQPPPSIRTLHYDTRLHTHAEHENELLSDEKNGQGKERESVIRD